MPVTETIKKGKIKRKVSSSAVEILHPETEASLVSYSKTIGGTAVTDVAGALDKIVSGIGVTGVKGNAESTYRTGNVNLTPANIGAATSSDITTAIQALDVPASGTGAITGMGAGKTIATLTETDGKVAATFQDIQIAESQVTNLSTDLGNKVDKLTSHSVLDYKVYAVNGNNQQVGIGADYVKYEHAIAMWDGNEQLQVNLTPTQNYHAASKKYVDDGLAGKVSTSRKVNDKALSSDVIIYGTDIPASSGVSTKLIDGNGKIPTSILPDSITGQLLYGGTVTAAGVATLSDAAKSKLGTTSNTITLTNDQTAITGYKANQGIFYIASSNASSGNDFAGLGLRTGDWLLSTGSAWNKIVNSDAVTGVKGNAESSYRIGQINLTPANLGISATTSSVTVGSTTFNQYSHPTGSGASKSSGLYKFSTDSTSHISGVTAVAKTDLSGLGAITQTNQVIDQTGLIYTGNLTFGGGASPTSGIILRIPSSTSNFEIQSFGSTSGNAEFRLYANGVEGSNRLVSIKPVGTTGSEIYLKTVGTGGAETTVGAYYLADNGTTPKQIATLSDIPSLTNYVTTNTAQTITADKTIQSHKLSITGTANTDGELWVGNSAQFWVGSEDKTDSEAVYTTIGNTGLSINHKAAGSGLSLACSYTYGPHISFKNNDNNYSYSLTFQNKSGLIAVTDDIPNSIISGKKANGSTDITSSLSNRVFTLGDSGISAGTYSAIQVNAKGIAVAGGQILQVIANGGTPTVVDGGWYFEENAA